MVQVWCFSWCMLWCCFGASRGACLVQVVVHFWCRSWCMFGADHGACLMLFLYFGWCTFDASCTEKASNMHQVCYVSLMRFDKISALTLHLNLIYIW